MWLKNLQCWYMYNILMVITWTKWQLLNQKSYVKRSGKKSNFKGLPQSTDTILYRSLHWNMRFDFVLPMFTAHLLIFIYIFYCPFIFLFLPKYIYPYTKVEVAWIVPIFFFFFKIFNSNNLSSHHLIKYYCFFLFSKMN